MHKTAVLALLTVSAFVTAAAQNSQIQISKDNRTLTINSTYTATRAADFATVHVGYVAYGGDLSSAYKAGSELSNVIYKALLKAGTAAKDIESQSQTVQPVQPFEADRWSEDEKRQRKFEVTQSWTVKCNAADASKVLGVAVEAGANSSGQIDWDLKDPNEFHSEVVSRALADAKASAKNLARDMGVTLGPLLYITTDDNERPALALATAGKMRAKAVEPLAVSPQQIQNSAAVTVVFEIQ